MDDDDTFLDRLLDEVKEEDTPQRQADATNVSASVENLLVDDQIDLGLGADQDLMESQEQPKVEQQEQPKVEQQEQEHHQEEHQEQEQHISNIKSDAQ